MKIRTQAKETLDDLSTASKRVVETAEWSTVALVAVAAVSVCALGCATYAIYRAVNHAH